LPLDVSLMVNRLKTGPGGTVGPQGGADVTIPVNSFARAKSIPVEPPYGPATVQPFALYNFVQEGTGETMTGRGTSGSLFDALWAADSEWWDNYVGDTYNESWNSSPPLFSSQGHFGGSSCANTYTFVLSVKETWALECQFVVFDDPDWAGWSLNIQGDSDYVSAIISSDFLGAKATTAYWDYSSALLDLEDNVIIVTLVPGSSSDHTLSINGAAVVGSPDHSSNATCSELDWSVETPDHSEITIFTAVGVNGLACLRGTADYTYWSTYDWATDPGFGG